MYSRYSAKADKPIQIPEHYSGVAFSASKRTAPPSAKPTPTFLDVATPTPPPLEIPPEPREEIPSVVRDVPVLAPVSEKNEHIREKTQVAASLSPIVSPLSSLFGSIGHAFPFSHGIGFEELLILGLILLLSRNDGEPDVILLLGLLLFCG